MTDVQQTQVHSTLDATIRSWNPPVLFVFLLPLAWMPFTTAKFVWLLVNMALIITAGMMLTRVYIPTAFPLVRLIFLVFVIGFPAVVAGLYMGQVTFLVFWGLILCLTLIRHEEWFWAGAALIFTAIKPHLTLLSVLYLLVFMARRRKWQGWIGLALTGSLCLMVLFLFRPGLLQDLQGALRVASVPWATSTIGGLLSYLGFSDILRYLILLLLPVPFLLVQRPETFRPELSVALLTLVTVPTTFFGWSYDQTILLIPIAQVFGWLPRLRSKWPILAAMACAIVINYYQRLLVINDAYYVWVPLFWWVLFAVVWRDISLMDHGHVYPERQSLLDRPFQKRT
jgi:hypothetical protein